MKGRLKFKSKHEIKKSKTKTCNQFKKDYYE